MPPVLLESRFVKICFAMSHLVNVTLMPHRGEAVAHQSVCSRFHYEATHGPGAGHWVWRWGRNLIDAIVFFDRHDGKGHCELSFERDHERAVEIVRHHERTKP